MALLEAKGLTKRYGSFCALQDLSLTLPERTIYGLLGPNGAGKSTFIRIVNQILAADEGEVLFEGEKLTREHLRFIGYMPEERGLYRKMKVGEQAIYFARLHGLSRIEAIRALRDWFQRFEIESWWGKKVSELSKGMAQKVQFIVTVAHRPKLLIFDEPFSGFDPINTQLLRDEILRLKEEGATVLFSTHNMESVEELCDSITLINASRNVLTGSVREVRRQFSQHQYSLRYTGEPESLAKALGSEWEIQNLPDDGEEHLAEIALRSGEGEERTNELLALIAPAVRIEAFSKASARMQDIFIKVVGNQANNETEREGGNNA